MGFRYFWLEGDDAVSDDDFRGRGGKNGIFGDEFGLGRTNLGLRGKGDLFGG